jgi:hypothetical protein
MKKLLAVAIIISLWVIPDAWGTRYLYSPPTAGSDGHLQRTAQATYILACSGTKTVSTSASTMTTGDRFTGVYDVWQMFIRFDLTALAGQTIESDSLMLWCTVKGAQNFGIFNCFRHSTDWSPLDTWDFLCWLVPYGEPPYCTATEVWEGSYASVTVSSWTVISNHGAAPICVPGQINAFMFDMENLCTIGNPPTGNRFATWGTMENSFPARRPYLIVNTVDEAGVQRRHIIGPGVVKGSVGDPSGLYMGRTR